MFLSPIDITNDIWKLENIEDTVTKLALGEGSDCATGSDCFDDPLRGGFQIDLTNSGFEFAHDSTVTVHGWSPRMKVTFDGETTEFVRSGSSVTIPPQSKIVEVACGGWCGSCTSELFVTSVANHAV